MIKKNDFILIGIILAIVLLIWSLSFFKLNWPMKFFMKTEGSKVRITVDGQEYKILDLDKDTTFSIEQENGKFNTFEIRDGYVDMIDASCPDKICVHQKEIHYDHETIVCLPNKVVLEIIDGQVNEVDSVAN